MAWVFLSGVRVASSLTARNGRFLTEHGQIMMRFVTLTMRLAEFQGGGGVRFPLNFRVFDAVMEVYVIHFPPPASERSGTWPLLRKM